MISFKNNNLFFNDEGTKQSVLVVAILLLLKYRIQELSVQSLLLMRKQLILRNLAITHSINQLRVQKLDRKSSNHRSQKQQQIDEQEQRDQQEQERKQQEREKQQKEKRKVQREERVKQIMEQKKKKREQKMKKPKKNSSEEQKPQPQNKKKNSQHSPINTQNNPTNSEHNPISKENNNDFIKSTHYSEKHIHSTHSSNQHHQDSHGYDNLPSKSDMKFNRVQTKNKQISNRIPNHVFFNSIQLSDPRFMDPHNCIEHNFIRIRHRQQEEQKQQKFKPLKSHRAHPFDDVLFMFEFIKMSNVIMEQSYQEDPIYESKKSNKNLKIHPNDEENTEQENNEEGDTEQENNQQQDFFKEDSEKEQSEQENTGQQRPQQKDPDTSKLTLSEQKQQRETPNPQDISEFQGENKDIQNKGKSLRKHNANQY